LKVAPEDVAMLVIAWHLESEQMCEFRRQGFVNGWTKLRWGYHLLVICGKDVCVQLFCFDVIIV